MITNLRPTTSGWAVVLLSVAALSLGGCGRKGGLDRPTADAASGPVAAAPADPETGTKSGIFNSNVDSAPAASRGTKKPFILDPLLGN